MNSRTFTPSQEDGERMEQISNKHQSVLAMKSLDEPSRSDQKLRKSRLDRESVLALKSRKFCHHIVSLKPN